MLQRLLRGNRGPQRLLALVLGITFGVSTAQAVDEPMPEMTSGSVAPKAEDKPMTDMKSGSAASQSVDKPPMTDMKSGEPAPQAEDKPMPEMTSGSAAPKAEDKPMAGMKSGSAASQAASMTEMMGAPGLVPFEIMSGQAGKWMVGYQFMFDKLDGNRSGTNDVSQAQVLDRFAASPIDMYMRMHMGMVMYAPTDQLTLMAMLPYESMSMGELHRDGTRTTERSQGLGDLELRSLYTLYSAEDLRHRVLFDFGVGVPTGSISQRDAEGNRLEYPMQIGSGTYAFLPGITYLGQALPWGWAADFNAIIRVGRNDVGYRLGNRYQSSVSIARELEDSVSISAGIRGELWKNIHGSDPSLDPTDEPTKDPNLQGGKLLSALFGITFHPQGGAFKGQHFHALLDLPVFQSLDGPQLKKKWGVRVGWQIEF